MLFNHLVVLMVASVFVVKLGTIDPDSSGGADGFGLARELFLIARRYTIEDAAHFRGSTIALTFAVMMFYKWVRKPVAHKGVNPLALFFAALFMWLLSISLGMPDNRVANVYVLPLLTEEECDAIVSDAEAGLVDWTTARHRQYATEDVPLGDLPRAHNILRPHLERSLFPFIAKEFCGSPQACNVTLEDGFIVRYRTDFQPSLDMHRDGHHVSFNLALSTPSVDFGGGGTGFQRMERVVRPPKGHAIVHGGALEHSGLRITRGVRYLVVGFLRVSAEDEAFTWTRLWGGLASEVRLVQSAGPIEFSSDAE